MPYNNFGGGGGGQRGGRSRPYSDPRDPEAEQYRKLFVGGLSYETTDDGLKAHFEQWGEIEDHVVMKDPNTKRSRGFGFITYTKAHMLDDAQAARPHKLDGREVETKRAMPREDSDKPDIHGSIKKMFIGAMKEGTTEDMIRELFSEYGEVAKVEMVMDKATGKPKSFCFVEFEDYDAVDKCVLKKEFQLNGKKVEVKKALPKASEGGGARGGRGGGRGGRGGGQGNFGGGFNQGGYGNQQGYGGGYNNYGGGYNDNSYGGGYNQGGGGYNQGGYNDYSGGYGGQGDWNSFGQGYSGNQGGGPMRGQYGGNQRGGAPYGGGNFGGGGGRGGGGFNR